MTYDAICDQCGPVEITKPMQASFPARHTCGAELHRVYSPIPVHYHAHGFYTSDVTTFRNQVGGERFAKFERRKAGIERRAARGQLTNYEKAVEAIT